MAAYVALQPHYNLMERELRARAGAAVRAPRARLHPLLRPRAGLSHAASTGPGGAQVDSPRAAGVRESYFNERGFAVLDALDAIAATHDAAVAAVALAWLGAQPTVLAPIASATSPEQLAELTASAELELARRRARAPRRDARTR